MNRLSQFFFAVVVAASLFSVALSAATFARVSAVGKSAPQVPQGCVLGYTIAKGTSQPLLLPVIVCAPRGTNT